MLGDRLADDVEDARDQRRFRLVAVGKAGVVRDIDVARVGPRRGDLAEHGEPAEPESKTRMVGAARRATRQAAPEHPLEDGIDVLEVMVEVEIGLDLLVAQLRAHVLVGLEQREEIVFSPPHTFMALRCTSR